MRFLLFVIASAIILAGCTTSATDSGETTNSDKIIATGTYSDLQIINEGRIFTVKINDQATRYADYRFYGDTLAIFWHDYMDCDNQDPLQPHCDGHTKGILFTGGKAGNLTGTWTQLPMAIISEANIESYSLKRELETESFFDPSYVYYANMRKTVYEFTDNELTVKQFRKVETAPEFDFSRTLLTFGLYTYLGSWMCNTEDSLITETSKNGTCYPLEWYDTLSYDIFPAGAMRSVDNYLSIDDAIKDLDINVTENKDHYLNATIFGVPLQISIEENFMIQSPGASYWFDEQKHFENVHKLYIDINLNGESCRTDISNESDKKDESGLLKECLQNALKKWFKRNPPKTV